MFDDAAAVVAAWHPGEEGGSAVWNILSGAVNPSGHTAHTWPRTVGQVRRSTANANPLFYITL